MKRNIFSDVESPLEIFSDERGLIVDIFYKEKIDHVAFIKTKSGEIRGNHYHKETTQFTLILKGKVEYWERSINGILSQLNCAKNFSNLKTFTSVLKYFIVLGSNKLDEPES